MLKIIKSDLLVTDPILVSKNSSVDEFSNIEVIEAKVGVKIPKSKSKSKSKNSVKFFLAKFQSFIQSSRLSFLIV